MVNFVGEKSAREREVATSSAAPVLAKTTDAALKLVEKDTASSVG